ncbi:MAG: transcriptional repressor [Synergistaceae bacterium]|nr:transcriptional repressor [Synergistaceae bacterium]
MRKVIRRKSTQREIVLEAVRSDAHMTAREIFDEVSRISSMSFGTVYRNLQVLEVQGEIARVDSDANATRYERKKQLHWHLYCRKCGGVFDFPESSSVSFDQDAEARSGFLIEERVVMYRGLCVQCRGTLDDQDHEDME